MLSCVYSVLVYVWSEHKQWRQLLELYSIAHGVGWLIIGITCFVAGRSIYRMKRSRAHASDAGHLDTKLQWTVFALYCSFLLTSSLSFYHAGYLDLF